MQVLDSGNLSSFLASRGEWFLGGKKIKELEQLFRNYHGTKHAVAFNSATAALHAAVIACGVQPGQEIITTPYTFTSTATCAFMANAIPVFSDIQPDTYNLDPNRLRFAWSSKTRAVIPVHLFGNPADMDEIIEWADQHNLRVIEDCAQAPGALYQGKKVGTLGDCGIFSLTENKAITAGEGGVLITDDDEIADTARLIRNHGEAVFEQKSRKYQPTILGYNYRMTEVDAAIGCEQFKKLDIFNQWRQDLAWVLTDGLEAIPGIDSPTIREGNTHVYYIYAMKYHSKKMQRDIFVKKLNDDHGVPIYAGYIKPLYLSPLYHTNKPYILQGHNIHQNYDEGICPVAEDCYKNRLIFTMATRPPAIEEHMIYILDKIEEILQ